jgi:hypothetical protein
MGHDSVKFDRRVSYAEWRRTDGHISELSSVRLARFRACNIMSSKIGLDAILTPV